MPSRRIGVSDFLLHFSVAVWIPRSTAGVTEIDSSLIQSDPFLMNPVQNELGLLRLVLCTLLSGKPSGPRLKNNWQYGHANVANSIAYL